MSEKSKIKDSELSKLLEDALENEKSVVKAVCHNHLREELYGEKLQNIVIFHLENFVKNVFDLALCNNLIEYDQSSIPKKEEMKMGKTRELPEWARNMTDEEWAKEGLREYCKGHTNCSVCENRLLLTLCRYDEPQFYCVEHCLGHKWQTDYDWAIECARCGIRYPNYLESVLDKHGIEFNRLKTLMKKEEK